MSEEIGRYLREQHAQVADLALWTCNLVVAADPDLTARVYRGWNGIGFRHPEVGYVCGVFPRERGVMLVLEHGASMQDPERVLEGEGTQTRFLRIDSPSDETAAVVNRYVQQAVAERLLAN